LTIGLASITTHTTSSDGSSLAIAVGVQGLGCFDGLVEIIHATTNGVIHHITISCGRVVISQNDLKLVAPVIAIDQCLSCVAPCLGPYREIRRAHGLVLQHVTPIRTGCIVCEGDRKKRQ